MKVTSMRPLTVSKRKGIRGKQECRQWVVLDPLKCVSACDVARSKRIPAGDCAQCQ